MQEPNNIWFDVRDVHGELTKGGSYGWDWSRNGGAYQNDRDFFSVHWEVKLEAPTEVRLHVESPRAQDDEALNLLKWKLVENLIKAAPQREVERHGFEYEAGRKASQTEARRNKSTEVFRVKLHSAEANVDARTAIIRVHRSMGPFVSSVVDKFSPELVGQQLSQRARE